MEQKYKSRMNIAISKYLNNLKSGGFNVLVFC